MKRINSKILTIGLVSFVFFTVLFTACKESFLDQTNTFQGSVDALSTTPQAVTTLVNGIYDTYQNSDLLKKAIWYRANFGSHDFFNWGGDVFWNNYQVKSTFGGLATLWNQSYIGIHRANSALPVIAKAQKTGVLSTSLANRLRGEALFLRGLTYYYLAANFGGVPLEVDTIGVAVNLGLRPRSPIDSVFMRVAADMKQAGTLLWSKKDLPGSELGRATKGAALAYEGAARMWLKDYTGALAAFNNAEFANYGLMPNFADVNEYDKQNNNESLFEIQFDVTAPQTQDWNGSWNPPGGEVAWIDSFSWPVEITQQGYDYGNPALWLSYQAGDKRKLLTIVGPGDTLASPGIIKAWGGIKGYIPVVTGYKSWVDSLAKHPTKLLGTDSANARKYVENHANFTAPGTPMHTVGSVQYPWYGADKGDANGNRTGYFCAKKWRDYNLTGNYGPQKLFGDQNQILMRYAEVLLSRAECKVRLGDNAGALADLALVRNRAWGGTAPAIMQDGANFDGSASTPITDPLQMVLSEYRHELAGEYSVFFNLVRAGTDVAIDFIKRANGTVDKSYDPIPNPAPGPTHDGKTHGLYNTTLTPETAVLPIPQIAISLNPNLTQNKDY